MEGKNKTKYSIKITLKDGDFKEFDKNTYKEMSSIITKCNKYIKNKNIIEQTVIRDFAKQYINVSRKFIINKDIKNNKEIKDVYKYVNYYTKKNLEYKILITEGMSEFKYFEKLSKLNLESPSIYKKLLQVLSIKYKKGYKKDTKELYENSKANQIQQKAKTIMENIIKLNKESYLINQEHLIKPTNNILEAIFYLPDIVVDNEDDLKKVIDYLYKMFWENNEIRKYSKNNELNIINDLRRYFYHDLEHGEEKSVKKKYINVKDIYNAGCGKTIPKTAKDWQNIQEYVYDKIQEFINVLNIETKEVVES